MVPATAAKYSEINIPQQSIEGVKNKKKNQFLNWIFWLPISISVCSRTMEGDPSLPMVTPLMVCTCDVLWSVFSEARNRVNMWESRLWFCRRAGRRGGGRERRAFKPPQNNDQKANLKKNSHRFNIFKTMWLFKPATWLWGGDRGWLRIFEYYRLAVFRNCWESELPPSDLGRE